MTQQSGSVAIVGGYVVPVDGPPVPNGTVLVADGRRAVSNPYRTD